MTAADGDFFFRPRFTRLSRVRPDGTTVFEAEVADGYLLSISPTLRNGLYADSAMTGKVLERAELQTKRRIVDEIYEGGSSRILRNIDHPDTGEMSKEEYMREHMDDLWRNLGVDTEETQYTTQQHQAWLVHVCTGLDMDWTPPHWRMLKARHEASRSKDARLIDNLFGRPPEPDMRPMDDFQ